MHSPAQPGWPVLCLVALAALPASAGAATYAPALDETISTGAAGANPTIALTASFGSSAVSTGALTYWVSTGHLAPTAWQTIQAAPAGTRLGTFTSTITGSDATQIRLQGTGKRCARAVRASDHRRDASGRQAARLRRSSRRRSVSPAAASTSRSRSTCTRPSAGSRLSQAPAAVTTATLALQGTIAYGGAVQRHDAQSREGHAAREHGLGAGVRQAGLHDAQPDHAVERGPRSPAEAGDAASA